MEIEIKIKFHFETEVETENRNILQEQSHERIFSQINEGYTSGELIESINDKTYYGRWSLDTTIIK